MEERTITITLNEYNELIAKAERISAVERVLERTEFPTIEDVKAILDVKEKVKEKDYALL